jgi:hypothetical protein
VASKRILTPAEVEALLEQFEPILRIAFLEAIKDITDQAEILKIAEALERRDIDAALRAVHLDPAAFRALDQAIAQVFTTAGSATAAALPTIVGADGLKVIFRFDARNYRAESWLAEYSSREITRIVEDQRDAIRAALTSGLERGTNPRTTALDIVGRINQGSKRREGGIIGLTSTQERYVDSARAELLSGDSTLLRNYLTRGRRNERFDGYVMRAIESGEPIDADVVARAIGKYSDSLLELRGETIARTETMASLNQARKEAMQQAIDGGAVRVDLVTKVWRSAGDSRVRDSHREMNGQTVKLNEKFVSPSGAVLDFPGDPQAPVAEIANCRCTYETRVDYLADIE